MTTPTIEELDTAIEACQSVMQTLSALSDRCTIHHTAMRIGINAANRHLSNATMSINFAMTEHPANWQINCMCEGCIHTAQQMEKPNG